MYQFIIGGLLFSGFFFLATCSQQPATGEAALAEQLLRTDSAFAEYSVQNGAAEAFREYLAEDALQLSAGANPLRGRDNIYASMQGDTSGVLSWTPEEAEVAQSGEMGYTWGEYIYEYELSDGTTGQSYGKYLNVWTKQQDGEWKVLIDMGNQSPPPNPDR